MKSILIISTFMALAACGTNPFYNPNYQGNDMQNFTNSMSGQGQPKQPQVDNKCYSDCRSAQYGQDYCTKACSY
jgi:predicted small lipoprotein YifL